MNEQRLLKPQEVAEMLGVSINTIYGWTSAGSVPYRKVGRLLRFDRAELDAWTHKNPPDRKNLLDERA